jgi:hypoxanthine phosphoribosyltransferase|tara:strand:+ start:280 stop:768 length:489 start_codon:yes stop_codon:yes gene_type:complete
MNKLYLTNSDIKTYCLNIVQGMIQDKWFPDYIVGITRGGLLPAKMLSHYMDIPMTTLDIRLRDGVLDGPESNKWLPNMIEQGKKILIVDDINDSGATFNWIITDWNITDSKWTDDVRFACLIDNVSSMCEYGMSYTGIEINKSEKDVWIVFPYEEWWNDKTI